MIKLLIVACSILGSPVPKDSVGIETVNGKVFVLHRVEEKETLFSISRRYRASVSDVLQNNPGADKRLDIGQIVKIPYTPKQSVPAGSKTHTVAQKETLYSISRLYGVTTEDLKKWNNLGETPLSVGQVLVVGKKSVGGDPVREKTVTVPKEGLHTVAEKETLFSIARQYGVGVQEIREWNKLEGSELKIGQTLIVSKKQNIRADNKEVNNPNSPVTNEKAAKTNEVVEAKKDPVVKPVNQNTSTVAVDPSANIKISESVRNGDEIVEGGIAELIEGTEGNRKYLALHRNAPVGTILKVRNEMNNREVFVRVMGKLPETAFSDKVVIRISKSAYDRLGAIDSRFRVEVTYYK